MTVWLGYRTGSWMTTASIAILGWLSGPTLAEAASETTRFAPHRAVYDVKLARAAPGTGVNDMKGRLVYELTGGGCEDYAQSMRFVTRSSGSDGTEQINDMRSSSSEAAAGQQLRFRSMQYSDDKLGEVTEGKAGRGGTSGDVVVELSKPNAKALSLPGATYFPIQHSLAMVEKAKAGTTRFEADVYDGSDKGDKVSATMTIIGKGRQPDAAALPSTIANTDRLKKLRYWPISTSFFEKGKSLESKDALPNYEMAAHFYENGVSTRLVMDYGDFSLKGELTELTFLPEPACGAAK
jgi:hypothetical protein